MKKGFTVWFTGLPCAGKTTIADLVEQHIKETGRSVEVFDGDIIRQNLSKGLGFSKEDRDTNIHRVGFICNLLTRNGVANIVACVSPYRQVRDENRRLIGNFIEVYVKCPVEVCIERDVKGLYKKALASEIKGFTGVDDPYEEPLMPEVVCETDKETPQESCEKVLAKLREMKYIS